MGNNTAATCLSGFTDRCMDRNGREQMQTDDVRVLQGLEQLDLTLKGLPLKAIFGILG